jgi:hypothetical protein
LRLCNTGAPPGCHPIRRQAPPRPPPPPRPALASAFTASQYVASSEAVAARGALTTWARARVSCPPARLRAQAAHRRRARAPGPPAGAPRRAAAHRSPRRPRAPGSPAALPAPAGAASALNCQRRGRPLAVTMRGPMRHHVNVQLSGTFVRGGGRLSCMLEQSAAVCGTGPLPVRDALAGWQRGSRRWAAAPGLPLLPAPRSPCISCATGGFSCSCSFLCNGAWKLAPSVQRMIPAQPARAGSLGSASYERSCGHRHKVASITNP